MTQSSEFVDDFLHKEYPKRFQKNEFWRQIKRTVNGQPVSENDIELIVAQVTRLLDLKPTDHVLDLGCGNGALASQFFSQVARYTGVDFSDYLLEIAREYFTPHNNVAYRSANIRDVPNYSTGIENVDKILIYGCIGYLYKPDTEQLLRRLKSCFSRLTKILIGNIPIRDRATEFFAARNIVNFDLDDPKSLIGVWWGIDELIQMTAELGFVSTPHFMPPNFYGSQYRFDLLLEKP